MGSLIKTFPLFALMLLLFNGLVAYKLYAAPPNLDVLGHVLATVHLPSGKLWSPTTRDALVMLGLMILYVEIFKSTSSSNVQILEHTFSFFIFLVYLMEFLLVPQVADSSFLILCLMSGIDVIAGFTISISAARKDFSVGG